MQQKRVLVVDDSVFMRRIVSDLVSEHSGFQVIGTAKNGKEAVEQTKLLMPDIITMDVEMPEMNGLQALQIIMRENPTPVIMLSSLTHEGATETIQALEWGAVDFVCKPSGSISLDLFKVKIILHEKLEAAAKARIRRSPAPAAPPPTGVVDKMPPAAGSAPPQTKQPLTPAQPRPLSQITGGASSTSPLTDRSKAAGGDVPVARAPKKGSVSFEQLVAIGTSTGGPRALQQVLTKLPGDFNAPIVIVQHMPPNFTHSLAVRLDSASQIRVVEGKDDMVLETGTAYIAPGGLHMRVVRESSKLYKLRITNEEPRGGHRPSVDNLFESILDLGDLKKHIVLMTGMGSDGARTMQALKAKKAETTIAESEETCVVYGMPRAAVELGCVDHVLPVHEIGDKLTHLVMKG